MESTVWLEMSCPRFEILEIDQVMTGDDGRSANKGNEMRIPTVGDMDHLYACEGQPSSDRTIRSGKQQRAVSGQHVEHAKRMARVGAQGLRQRLLDPANASRRATGGAYEVNAQGGRRRSQTARSGNANRSEPAGRR